jgi:hypothetical protein
MGNNKDWEVSLDALRQDILQLSAEKRGADALVDILRLRVKALEEESEAWNERFLRIGGQKPLGDDYADVVRKPVEMYAARHVKPLENECHKLEAV